MKRSALNVVYPSPAFPFSVSRTDLIQELQEDLTLTELFQQVCPVEEMENVALFHQTFKLFLRSYCTELGCDWEEELPWLVAAREVTQESNGFSPNDLVFGHTVCGPLTVLQADWKKPPNPTNVSGFKRRLYETFAKTNLENSQE